ncbi:MAG TPA: hypothetical protein VKG26_12545 [Bacteroidia bacterium]|nr:hypothetical protein [Bacteroidia bacterium]
MAEDKNIAYFNKGFSLNLCCKQATYLLLKKEEKPLSFKEEYALKFHMSICKLCRAFKIQSEIMNNAINKNLNQMVLMPQKEKNNLKVLINSNLGNI